MTSKELLNQLVEIGFTKQEEQGNQRSIYTCKEQKELWKTTKYSVIPGFNITVMTVTTGVKIIWEINIRRRISVKYNEKELRRFNSLTELLDHFLVDRLKFVPPFYRNILYLFGWKGVTNEEQLSNVAI